MSSFALKIFACVCMFCDHFGNTFIGKTSFLNYIGRFAFTIFCFQIVQGYIYTSDIKKYIKRLLIFALISQIPFSLYFYLIFHQFGINVIFTLLFGLIAILVYDKYNKGCGILSCIFLGLLAQFCKFDYGFYGVFIIFLFYILREHKLALTFTFIITVILKYYIPLLIKYNTPITVLFINNIYSMLMCFTFLSILPIFLYNGKKGKSSGYLFYIFYPAHLLLLSILVPFI